MGKHIENFIETCLFRGRWLLAFFFFGLFIGLGLLLYKFLGKVFHLVVTVNSMDSSGIIIGVLSLVDMTLIACLLIMIIFSGYEVFVSKMDVHAESDDTLNWLGALDFGSLKLKVIGAVVAISAVELLQVFLAPASYDERQIFWRVVIHGLFVLSGLIFALTEYVAGKTPKH